MYDASKFFIKKQLNYGTGDINTLMIEKMNPVFSEHFDVLISNEHVSNFGTKLHELIEEPEKNNLWFERVRDLCEAFTDLGTYNYFGVGCDAGIIAMYFLLLWLEEEKDGNIVPVIPDLHITSYTKDINVVHFGKHSTQQMFILEFEYQGEYMTICDMEDVMIAEMLITINTDFITKPYMAERVAFGSSLDDMLFNKECDI